MIQGRCIWIENNEIRILTDSGTRVLRNLRIPKSLQVGDIVSFQNETLRVDIKYQLIKNSARLKFLSLEKKLPITFRIQNPKRLHALKVREQVEQTVREFFITQGFREVRTPLFVPNPGMEPHLKSFSVKTEASPTRKNRIFLPTSPELAMKKLLVGGLTKIFQICPAFRNEPESNTHLSEFVMLEWYRAFSNFEQIMADVEKLFETLALSIHKANRIPFGNSWILLKPPWPRLKIRDLFSELADVDLVRSTKLSQMRKHAERLKLSPRKFETWDDLFFKIWLNLIEPKLPSEQAVLVTHYPPSQASMSVIAPDSDAQSDADLDESAREHGALGIKRPLWAKRFEVFAGGLELGNAFEELTDPEEQNTRFKKDGRLRKKLYGKEDLEIPFDQDFINALREGMPPSAGIAMGIDRMVMLLANEPDISNTVWLKSHMGYRTSIA